jgi:hypothetical protein
MTSAWPGPGTRHSFFAWARIVANAIAAAKAPREGKRLSRAFGLRSSVQSVGDHCFDIATLAGRALSQRRER